LHFSLLVGFDNSVLKVLALSDNKTMAFGNFTKFNGVLCNRIARLADDGSIDTTFNGIGANNTVRSALCNQTISCYRWNFHILQRFTC
jgi:hypothetical protein